MKWEKLKPPEPDEPMCCCECDHLGQHCGGCWDCSDVDEACHRWLKRTPLRSESSSLGAAIRRLEVSTVPALLLLPVLLRVAALHCLLGVAVLTALPALVLWYYYATHRRKRRTLFFLALALYSLGYMYYLFLAEILPRGDVHPRQVCTVTIGMVLTLVSLVRTKRGPGFVVVTPAGSQATAGLVVTPGGSQQASDPTHHHHHHHSVPAQSSSEHHHKGYQQQQQQQHNGAGGGTPATTSSSSSSQAQVQSVGRGGRCPLCRALRPPRAGHCRICGSCVKRLDHHCIWINSCVGAANHRSFLLTLCLFLLTSLYGISLVLHSVCPRQYLVTALLYCPGVYDHYSTALCFTCAWYSSIVTGGLLHLLLLQVLNISYNVTEREAQLAMRNHSGQRRLYGMVIDTGLHSRGFYRNWLEFLTMADDGDDHGSVPTSSSSLSV